MSTASAEKPQSKYRLSPQIYSNILNGQKEHAKRILQREFENFYVYIDCISEAPSKEIQ